ncbi:MAG: hypothetical protein QW327_00155 [Candidatus Odinarchaeota archaeon]
MMSSGSSIVSDIRDIPGSSFKIQIEKKPSSALIRILRGLKVTKEIEIERGELTKNRVVTIIQSELFMPISPFKIMKIVEELFKNIEDKEKQAASLESQVTPMEGSPPTPEKEVVKEAEQSTSEASASSDVSENKPC